MANPCARKKVSIRRLLDEYAAIHLLRAELGLLSEPRTGPVAGMVDELERAVAAVGQDGRGRRARVRLDVAALAFGERARLERLRDQRAGAVRAA